MNITQNNPSLSTDPLSVDPLALDSWDRFYIYLDVQFDDKKSVDELMFRGGPQRKSTPHIRSVTISETPTDMWFLMRRITNMEKLALEDEYKLEVGEKEGPGFEAKPTSYDSIHVQYVRRFLISCGFDMPITHQENGWLTDECWSEVQKLHPRILNALSIAYESDMIIGDEERILIDTQSMMLFKKDPSPVTNPCRAISLYNSLALFHSEFGLNYFDLLKLPYHEYIRLRTVINNKNEAMARERKTQEGLQKTARNVQTNLGRGGPRRRGK